MTPAFVVGKIDRISNSGGNAMLRADGEEYNLGPLDSSTVGNTVIAVPMTGPWALCLTPYDDSEAYLSQFYSTTGIDEAEARQQLRGKEALHMTSVSDFFAGDCSSRDSTDFAVGDTIEVEVTIGTPDRSYVIFEDGTTIEVVDTYLPAGGKTTLELVEVTDVVSKARLSPTVLERASEPGAELRVTVQEKAGSTGCAIHDGVPIVLPECSASKGDTLRVAVTEHLETGVEARITALPTEALPDVGDVLTFDVELPAHNSTSIIVHDGIPIEITQTALSMEGALPIEILELRANAVTGRVDLAAYSGLSEGAQLSIEGLVHRDDQLVGKQNEIPIVVPLSGPIPSVPDSLSVTVTEIRADAAYASIRHRPEIRELRDGAAITVTTTGRTDEYLIAEYEGCPVWVSWPFDEAEAPPRLTVEVSAITDYGLFASPPVFPDTESSQRGDVLPARVEAVHSDYISASIVEPIKGEPYVLPVRIPISFDVSGEIGIVIDGQEQSYLVGIVRTLETGENVTQVPVYLQKIQETLLAIRKQQFEAAAESARAAAGATETAVRRAEALRFQVFASGEAILSAGGSDEQVLDEIAEFSEKMSSLDLPDTYRDLIDTELNLYEELLSVGTNRVPDSVQGLQRIAYNIDARGRLDGIASRIRGELLEAATDFEVDGWAPEFPHRLLVFRVGQVCTQFEYPPEIAMKLVDQYPSITRLQLQIAPESSPEPLPDETVSVVPNTFERSSSADGSSDTVEAPDDGPSDSSGKTDAAANDESPSDQQSGTTAEDTDASDERPESLSTDTHTSAPAETIDGAREPAEDSSGAEPPPTKSADVAEDDKVTRDSAIPDVEITTSTTPTTTSQLRALRAEADAAASDDPIRDTSSTGGGSRYQRAPAIKKYVQTRADGVCELCGEQAPFETPDGRPYLETHHVDELGQGGKDHPDKVAAVCPTCHKRIHYGADGDALNETLRERLEDGLADVGVE